MSATKSSVKKRVSESEQPKPEVRKRAILEEDFDADLSEDINVLMSALKQIKEKAHKDDQKKNEEAISSLFHASTSLAMFLKVPLYSLDFPKLNRCTELLSMNEELKQARKAFEVDEEKLATLE
nr:transcription initiation factor TFIID subunit 13-like [Ipomoea batatas]